MNDSCELENNKWENMELGNCGDEEHLKRYAAKFSNQSPFGKEALRFNSPEEALSLLKKNSEILIAEHRIDQEFIALERSTFLETIEESREVACTTKLEYESKNCKECEDNGEKLHAAESQLKSALSQQKKLQALLDEAEKSIAIEKEKLSACEKASEEARVDMEEKESSIIAAMQRIKQDATKKEAEIENRLREQEQLQAEELQTVTINHMHEAQEARQEAARFFKQLQLRENESKNQTLLIQNLKDDLKNLEESHADSLAKLTQANDEIKQSLSREKSTALIIQQLRDEQQIIANELTQTKSSLSKLIEENKNQENISEKSCRSQVMVEREQERNEFEIRIAKLEETILLQREYMVKMKREELGERNSIPDMTFSPQAMPNSGPAKQPSPNSRRKILFDVTNKKA